MIPVLQWKNFMMKCKMVLMDWGYARVLYLSEDLTCIWVSVICKYDGTPGNSPTGTVQHGRNGTYLKGL